MAPMTICLRLLVSLCYGRNCFFYIIKRKLSSMYFIYGKSNSLYFTISFIKIVTHSVKLLIKFYFIKNIRANDVFQQLFHNLSPYFTKQSTKNNLIIYIRSIEHSIKTRYFFIHMLVSTVNCYNWASLYYSWNLYLFLLVVLLTGPWAEM